MDNVELSAAVSAPRQRSLAVIAAAYAKEERDVSLVRANLPQRIDSFLPTQLGLQFDHDLAHTIGCAAHRAAKQGPAEAWAIAQTTFNEVIEAVVIALEGLEVRLKARSQTATASGLVALDAERRSHMLRSFCDDLAEAVVTALPEVAKISRPQTALLVKAHARRDLQEVEERFSAVMFCKTQLTDLYNDNAEISAQHRQDLLREALSLLNAATLPRLRCSDHMQVVKFFQRAISQCQDPQLKEAVAARLASILVMDRSRTFAHQWIRTASRVLTTLADAAAEGAAAVTLQRFWRKWATSVLPGLRAKRRLSSVHALDPRDAAMAGVVDNHRDCGHELVLVLLRQAWALVRHLPNAPHALRLERLQHACSSLADVHMDALAGSGDAHLAFWLNVHSLGVMLGLLIAAQSAITTFKPPATAEAWEAITDSGRLLVAGFLLSPNDVAHVILGAGAGAPLRPPRRKSMWIETPCIEGSAEPLLSAGLWLPVKFGLPPFRVYRPDTVRMQLRLNAEALVRECSEAAELSGLGPSSLLLPPLLQSLGTSAWMPLLARRGSEALETQVCSVEWAFDHRKLTTLGVDAL